jgi:site-specific DNA recombinase
MNTQRSRSTIRCAIYCRKSTDEGLSQEFNTLDAQRESCLAYIASQKQQGWVALPERYDDGGYSGGTTDRPALQRLLADIEAGNVDCVVTHRLDRLSRSLTDFANLMATFERKNVSFVSVTQQFASNTSMGRLTLHILMSFAQFEREVIGERTRDKIAATRRNGLYVLGKPLLGYDLVSAPPPFTGKRLAVNAAEAEIVRELFDLYLEHRSLLDVAHIANQRGWRTKAWTTTAGRTVGGMAFDKALLSKLLKNPLYAGLVPHHGATFKGQHEAIVTPGTFAEAQRLLTTNTVHGGVLTRQTNVSLLRGLVRCGSCDCAMTPTTAKRATKDGGVRHHLYYVCSSASKRGRDQCPRPSIPAGDLDLFVIEQIRTLVMEDASQEAIMARAFELAREGADVRKRERDELRQRLATNARPAPSPRERQRLQRRLAALERHIDDDERRTLDADEVTGAAESFDLLWQALTPLERHELAKLLIASVTFDAATESATVAFREGVGITTASHAQLATATA